MDKPIEETCLAAEKIGYLIEGIVEIYETLSTEQRAKVDAYLVERLACEETVLQPL